MGASPPIPILADVNDNHIRMAKHLFDLMDRNSGDLFNLAGANANGVAENQQDSEPTAKCDVLVTNHSNSGPQ